MEITGQPISSMPLPPENAVRRVGLPSPAAIDALDATLDLTNNGRDLLGALGNLDAQGRIDFLRMLADLLRAGVVGMETLEVDGQPYTSFVTTRVAAPHLRGARPYRDPHPTGLLLDRQA